MKKIAIEKKALPKEKTVSDFRGNQRKVEMENMKRKSMPNMKILGINEYEYNDNGKN